MNTELIPALTESLMSEDEGNIEQLYEKVYQLILQAFSNGTVEQTRQQFSTFYCRFEQIESLLGLDEHPEGDCRHLKAFYLGQIKSAADLLSDVAILEQKYQQVRRAAKNNEYLVLCLQTVNEHPRISGTELRKILQLKNSSSLSKFIDQVAPYELFYIQKIGSSNYYSLSPNGREYLRIITNFKTDITKTYDETFILLLLSAISTEFQEHRPSAARVISKVNQGSQGSITQGMSILLKGKINKIFSMHKKHLQKMFTELTQSRRGVSYYFPIDTNYSQTSLTYVDTNFDNIGDIYEN